MAAPAFPAYHVTGAVHHYIEVTGTDPIYLGTCEATPLLSFFEHYSDIKNTLHGPQLPAQRVEAGESAHYVAGLNRFSQSTYNTLQTAVGANRRSRFSRGLLVFGRTTFKLWAVFENYLDANVRALFPGLQPGFYFPQCHLLSKQTPRMGTIDTLNILDCDIQPYYTPQANSAAVAAGEREFLLYSQHPDDFPAEVLVPQ